MHFLDCSVRSYGTFRTGLQPEQIEAVQTRATTQAARLKGTLSNLPAVELSTNNSFGAPPHIFFPNDIRCGFRKLKEEGVGNRRSGAAVVPKSLLL